MKERRWEVEDQPAKSREMTHLKKKKKKDITRNELDNFSERKRDE